MKSPTDEAMETLQREKESRVNDHEAYEGRVDGLLKEVDEALKKYIKRVQWAFD